MERVSTRGQLKGVQSVDRALRILEALGLEPDGLRLSEIAERVELAPSTVHRLLTTMEQRRFVNFLQSATTWHVGRQAFKTGAAFVRHQAFIIPATPLMRALRDTTRETVNIGGPEDGNVVVLAQVESRAVVRVINSVGGRAPLSSSGLGKAILATYDEDALSDHILRHGLPRCTSHTLVDPAVLRADLRATRHRGYALDDQEHCLGLHCIAAPVFAANGDAVVSLSVSGLAGQITPDRDATLGALVVASAGELTASVGGVRPEGWCAL